MESSTSTTPAGDGNWRKLRRASVLREYKAISDYGLIGDLKTTALVGIDGSIDWLCLPRFDSPSVFCSVLDLLRGGKFRIMPTAKIFSSYQHYDGPTNILITEFRDASGHTALTDFMPCIKVNDIMISSGEIHRRVNCLEGSMKLEMIFQPRFNYGALTPQIRRVKEIGYTFFAKPEKARHEVALITPLPLREIEEGTLSISFELKEGESLDFVLRYGGARAHHKLDTYTDIKLKETKSFWLEWSSNCKYVGRWRDEIVRSALALKLLEYSPTGAIVAAPTSSLPEQIRGVRNWDYRYSWIRDSSFVLWAFHSLGFEVECSTYLNWILSIFYLTGGNLQVVLGITGERDITETELRHLEGYRRSSPVRVGNGASNQFQLDVYGILLDAMYFTHKHGGGLDSKTYNYLIKQIMDALVEDWKKPDCGIWEVRGEKKNFVYSKVWCWVAADRAAKIANSLFQAEDAEKWGMLRDEIKSEIMTRGWNDSLKSFVRSYDSTELDSANLLMPQVRFIDYKDPKMISTLELTMKRLLSKDKFLYRYMADDGLPGKEGAFFICSFWLVTCLAEAGRVEQATKIMDALVNMSNHLGLFSEEIDPNDGTMLGNFPQAFTHMGFITAANAVNRALQQMKEMGAH